MKITSLAVIFSLSFFRLFSQPTVSFVNVVSNLTQPVDVVAGPSDRLYIVEQPGQIKIWDGKNVQKTPFLDVSSLISTDHSERGLLSLAFHPDYASNGWFFIYYTNKSGAVTVARYKSTSPDAADLSSGVVLMTIPKPFKNHNGGKLLFGKDGYLYFGTGDGGSGGDPYNNAQTGSSLLGKMIRIDVNNTNPPYYKIPPTNPYVSSKTIRPEIIAIGLRNPWRYSFDKKTGEMWIADVGQDAWEEVDVVDSANRLGRNYGWHCKEGTHDYKEDCTTEGNIVKPVFEYPHDISSGGYSITGGYVYRGDEFPALQGYYLVADFMSRNGWLISPNGNGSYKATMQKKMAFRHLLFRRSS